MISILSVFIAINPTILSNVSEFFFQMKRSRLGGTWERTNNFCCQGLDWQPSLCKMYFPGVNISCLCLSVDRWQVMMVFSSLFLITYFLLLFFVELLFHVVFPDLNLPKTGPQNVRFFDCFFFLWCWYCVSFPWVSEVEIEIAVTKTNCMYTASSKVVQETSSSWLIAIIKTNVWLYHFPFFKIWVWL